MSGSAEWPGSLVKSLLSMAAQKPSHSRTKLLLEMPPGMAMSLYRSLQGNCAVTKGGERESMRDASICGERLWCHALQGTHVTSNFTHLSKVPV